MEKLDWEKEESQLPLDSVKKFQYITTPHNKELLYVLDNEDAYIYVFTKDSNNHLWKIDAQRETSITIYVEKHPGMSIDNFTLFYDNRGDLCLLLTLNHQENRKLFFLKSQNYGKKWKQGQQISPEFEAWTVKSPPILLDIGVHIGYILVPIENFNTKRALTLISADNGKTWNFSLYIEPIEQKFEDNKEYNPSGTHNPVVFEGKNGKIKVCFWTEKQEHLCVISSKDRASTWSEGYEINMPLEPSSPYHIINLKPEEHQVSPFILFTGIITENDKKTLALYRIDTDFDNIEKLWKSTPLKGKVQDVQLYQDFHQKIHLLYLINSEVFHLKEKHNDLILS